MIIILTVVVMLSPFSSCLEACSSYTERSLHFCAQAFQGPQIAPKDTCTERVGKIAVVAFQGLAFLPAYIEHTSCRFCASSLEHQKANHLFQEVEKRCQKAFELANSRLEEQGIIVDLGYAREKSDPKYQPTEPRKFAFSLKKDPSFQIPLNSYDIASTDQDTKIERVSWDKRPLLSSEQIADTLVAKVQIYLNHYEKSDILFSNPSTELMPYPSGTLFSVSELAEQGHKTKIDQEGYLLIDNHYIAFCNQGKWTLIKANMLHTDSILSLKLHKGIVDWTLAIGAKS